MTRAERERRALQVLVAGTSLLFAWITRPWWGAIFWAVVLAIVFAPLRRRIAARLPRRPALAALATWAIVVFGVGVPLAALVLALFRQAGALYADVAQRRIDVAAYAQRVATALPPWAHEALDHLGLGDLGTIEQRVAASAVEATRFVATHLFAVGMNAFSFALGVAISLYLLYVGLRHGEQFAARLERLLPLSRENTDSLATTLATAIRATVRGGVAMAAVQGLLGGLVLGALGFEAPLFWGVVFGVLSMIPAVGAGLLWGPIAIYYLASGAIGKAIGLVLFGSVVLTVVDNTLRPVVVGRSTQLPAWVILVATLGGIATLGLEGVVVGPLVAALCLAAWRLFDAHTAAPPTGDAPPDQRAGPR